MPDTRRFHAFISYKSEDHTWAEKLKNALQQRGVRVWLDKDQIRPGDRFIRALEDGLQTSKCVVLVVTPESMSSGWVEDEYHRALQLSNQGKVQLIPILLRDAALPGFLSNRQVIDFRQDLYFDKNVDQLVWPGITGKRVAWYAVNALAKRVPLPHNVPPDDYLASLFPHHRTVWSDLYAAAKYLGIEFYGAEDIHRSDWYLEPLINDPSCRLVLVFDVFESRPAQPEIARNTAKEYIDTMFDFRERTRGAHNEIVFLLYHTKGAWSIPGDVAEIPPDVVKRLQHYFQIEQGISDQDELRRQLREVWNKIQRELMLKE